MTFKLKVKFLFHFNREGFTFLFRTINFKRVFGYGTFSFKFNLIFLSKPQNYKLSLKLKDDNLPTKSTINSEQATRNDMQLINQSSQVQELF